MNLNTDSMSSQAAQDYADYFHRANEISVRWGLTVTDDDHPGERSPNGDELKDMIADHLADLDSSHGTGDLEAMRDTLRDFTRTVELALVVEMRDQARTEIL